MCAGWRNAKPAMPPAAMPISRAPNLSPRRLRTHMPIWVSDRRQTCGIAPIFLPRPHEVGERVGVRGMPEVGNRKSEFRIGCKHRAFLTSDFCFLSSEDPLTPALSPSGGEG